MGSFIAIKTRELATEIGGQRGIVGFGRAMGDVWDVRRGLGKKAATNLLPNLGGR